jgi:hypothetical protein
VGQWLSKKLNIKWLLVIDGIDRNFTRGASILDFIPPYNWGKIIVTSRRPKYGVLGHSLKVREIDDSNGVALLIKGMKRDRKKVCLKPVSVITIGS